LWQTTPLSNSSAIIWQYGIVMRKENFEKQFHKFIAPPKVNPKVSSIHCSLPLATQKVVQINDIPSHVARFVICR